MKKEGGLFSQLAITVAVALTMCAASINPAWAKHAGFVAGELLIQTRAGVSKGNIDKLVHGQGAATAGEIERIRVRKIKAPVHAIEKIKTALEKNPNISFVEYNHIADAGFDPNDEKYPSQWHLAKISAPDAWNMGIGSTTMPIAIIDSGVDPTHPDLADKLIAGYNFVDNNTDTHDVLGHGTAVAGSAAALSNNVTGVAGVAWDNPIMPLVVLNADDWASYYDIARAITYAADQGVRVMNISIGGSSSSSTLQNAADYAWNRGAVIFACAHNYSTNTPYYPAACDHVVSVAATTSTDTKASFSNYGDWIDIAAPGVSILTTSRGGGYGGWSGTSFSSPITAGVAALILSASPSLTNAQVVDILTQNADDLGESGFDPYFGYGRVNAYQSLVAAMGSVPEPDTTPPSVSLTTLGDGATVSGAVSIGVSATDNGSIDRVELYVDGNRFATDTTSPYSFYWDTSEYADGPYDLSAIAYDAAGNSSTSGFITVYVSNPVVEDTVAPAVSIVSPADGTTLSSETTVTVSAADDGGIGYVELYIGGNRLGTDTTAPYSFDWNAGDYADGSYELWAVAYDSAGNMGQSDSIRVNVSTPQPDLTAPTVTITSPRDGTTLASRETIKASASDNDGISRMELYVDGVLQMVKAKSALSWNWNVRKESSGAHTIKVTAFDMAGNEGIDTITVYK